MGKDIRDLTVFTSVPALQSYGFRELVWTSADETRQYGKTQLNWSPSLLPGSYIGPAVLRLETTDGMFQLTRPAVTFDPVPTFQDWANSVEVFDVFPPKVLYTTGDDMAVTMSVMFPDAAVSDMRCVFKAFSEIPAEEELEIQLSDGSAYSHFLTTDDAEDMVHEYVTVTRSVTDESNVILNATVHIRNASATDAGLRECAISVRHGLMEDSVVLIKSAVLIAQVDPRALPRFIDVDMEVAFLRGGMESEDNDHAHEHHGEHANNLGRVLNGLLHDDPLLDGLRMPEIPAPNTMPIGHPNAIRCRVRSNPYAFSVVMLKDGVPDLQSSRLTLTKDQEWSHELVYNIPSVGAEHAGRYTCIAINVEGCEQQTINVEAV